MVSFEVQGEASGHQNMRRDEELLRIAEAQNPMCRLYGWSGPWVSLGRFQKPEETIAPGFSDYVLRPTGGKAVLHGHDHTVALALPFTGGSVKKAYRLAIGPLLGALNRCGLPATMAGVGSGGDLVSRDCFASASPYDFIDRDSRIKVAGVAMRINRRALLLQASIPYTSPLIAPDLAIKDPHPVPILDWRWQDFPEALCAQMAAWSPF
jgi:lipoate-protein ligase A